MPLPPISLSLPAPPLTVSSPSLVAISSDRLVPVKVSLPSVKILIDAFGKFVEVSLPKGSPMVSAAKSR